MTAVTAAQAHRIMKAALADRADKCRKVAAGRGLSGQVNASARAALRAEAQYCLVLAKRLELVSPVALVALLGPERAS
jgi:hypothetical protein